MVPFKYTSRAGNVLTGAGAILSLAEYGQTGIMIIPMGWLGSPVPVILKNKIMRNLYKYLYYRAYDLLSLTGNFDLSFGASHLLSLFFTLLTQIIVFKFCIQKDLKLEVIATSSVLLFLSFHIINYFVFLKKENFKIIIGKYSGESIKSKAIARAICILILIVLIYYMF